MAELLWDQTGDREFEVGIEKGVLYPIANDGSYGDGVAWNGLTSVSEAPSGAAVTKKYADNINYLSLVSAEIFEATIKAYTYPDEWEECDGSAAPYVGISVGQQTRRPFGMSYKTLKGNDTLGQDFGYILHLVYGGLASPSQKDYNTVNDTPDAIEFSWKISTTPVSVPGLKPSAIIKIDSTKVDPTKLASLEALLHGQAGTSASLPSPADVFALFAGAGATAVVATMPAFVAGTGVITVPSITGVQYYRGDTHATLANGSTVTIPTSGASLVIQATAKTGFILAPTSDDDWSFTRS